MMKRRSMAAALLLVLPLGLRAQQPAPDLERLEAELRAAEVAFARSVEVKDFEAFRSMLHESATFGGGQRVLRGRERVAEAWRAAFFAEGSPSFRWRPETVSVATSGDLGLSTGPYESVRREPDGNEVVLEGTFFSVWRRVDGAWKIVLDGGTPGRPRESQPPPGSR
jgi:ketosteroid isomerase-like protein